MAKNKFPVGCMVVFKGYADDVPEEERMLEEGETYEVAETTPAENSLAIQIENPDFNSKKKETEENSKMILVDVFYDEVTLAEAEEEPAPKAKGKAATKPATKAKAKAEPEEEPEEEPEDETEAEDEPAPKAKGKAATKPAGKAKAAPAAKEKTKVAAKGKAKPAAKAKAKPDVEEDKYPELENEDEEIVALVEGADLLELAAELIEDSAALDYKLGGVLYHVRLTRAYESVDKKYKENGGFGLYVKEHLNTEYRKAMYLIDIYYNFNKFGIDPDKVQELGWTKCAKIAAVMNEDNAEDLVELAEGSSVSDLVDSIKESYSTEGGTKSGGEQRKRITFKFRLLDEAGDAVSQVLAAAQADLGMKDVSDAFEHIVMEWAAEHDIAVKTKGKAKAKATDKAPAKAEAPAAKSTRRATAKA